MDMDNFIRKTMLSEIIRKQMELSPIQKEVKPITPEIITKPEKKSYMPTIKETFEDYPEERPRNLPLGDGQLILELAEPTDDEDLYLLQMFINPDKEDEPIWIQAKTLISHELAQEAAEKDQKPKVILPEQYQEYTLVFDKHTLERMPIKQPWDHAINLKDGFVPKDCKIYPMSLIEQEKLDEFIDENMQKGYIRPSKSPMASPFFFVSKKEMAKL
jgi:hypothetical protein